MSNQTIILEKRLSKLEKHYLALKEYKGLIDDMRAELDIFDIDTFQKLEPQKKAILDAYLKRFSSVQDFLGAKIFNLLLDIAGISYTKMSEVLYYVEKEDIIDTLDNWIELREVRNDLEHDYPENINEALDDLKFCIDSFDRLEGYYLRSLNFVKRYAS